MDVRLDVKTLGDVPEHLLKAIVDDDALVFVEEHPDWGMRIVDHGCSWALGFSGNFYLCFDAQGRIVGTDTWGDPREATPEHFSSGLPERYSQVSLMELDDELCGENYSLYRGSGHYDATERIWWAGPYEDGVPLRVGINIYLFVTPESNAPVAIAVKI